MYYINIPNNSHYLTDYSKRSFKLVNPSNFKAQQSKQLGYYIRTYYHFQHVQLLGGKTYFYTLTYNDKALPHFTGVPCVDYNDLRYFLRSSGFDKHLQREYGYKLQYFITCELGEGKGVRGYGNNPHYHVIFFLLPNRKQGVNYKYLTDSCFCNIVKYYWQGSDYPRIRKQDYKFGVAMPGDNLGKVNSGAALSYCSKYVLKDVMYNTLKNRLKAKQKELIFDRLINMKMARNVFLKLLGDKELTNFEFSDHLKSHPLVVETLEYFFNRVYKNDLYNRYLPKVRISTGVGLYALNKVNDDGLTISIPYDRKTIKTVNVPLYLYRKMYYDIVKDDKGNNKYILNNSGIKKRLDQFDFDLNKQKVLLYKVLDFNKIKISDLDDLQKSAIDVFPLYSLVYRDRLIPSGTTTLHPLDDYELFLTSEYYYSNYMDDVENILHFNGKMTYINHPEFFPYKNIFEKFDNLIEQYYICQSNSSHDTYLQIMRTKKHFSKQKFNDYLSYL